MLNNIEKFLEQFPKDATSWMQATDEVRDLARVTALLNQVAEAMAVAAEERKRKQRNVKPKKSTLKL